MKMTKESIVNIIIIIATLIFLGLSFADFYIITTTCQLPDLDGGVCAGQTTEEVNNSMLSVVCSLIPFIKLIHNKKWTRILSIFVSILNFIIITLIAPFSVSASSLLGGSSASLTGIGWTAAIILVIIMILLFFEEYSLNKNSKRKGGNEE